MFVYQWFWSIDENYYPQVDLEESKYVVKEKKMPNTDKEIFFVRNVF